VHVLQGAAFQSELQILIPGHETQNSRPADPKLLNTDKYIPREAGSPFGWIEPKIAQYPKSSQVTSALARGGPVPIRSSQISEQGADVFVLLSQDELDENSHHHSRTLYDPLF